MSEVAINPFWPYENNDVATDEQVRGIAPGLDWDAPLPAHTLDGNHHGYACRLCASRHGLKAENIKHLPQTLEAFEQHRKDFHQPGESSKCV